MPGYHLINLDDRIRAAHPAATAIRLAASRLSRSVCGCSHTTSIFLPLRAHHT